MGPTSRGERERQGDVGRGREGGKREDGGKGRGPISDNQPPTQLFSAYALVRNTLLSGYPIHAGNNNQSG